MSCNYASCKEYGGEEEERFFDAREDISAVSDSCPDSPVSRSAFVDGNLADWVSWREDYGFWVVKPDSVQERRSRFGKWMGLTSDSDLEHNLVDHNCEVMGGDELSGGIERVTSGREAELRNLDLEAVLSDSSLSTLSSGSRDLDRSALPNADDWQQECSLRRLLDDGLNKKEWIQESQRRMDTSSSVQHFTQREDKLSATSTSSQDAVLRGRKNGWLKKLGIGSCVVGVQGKDAKIMSSSQIADKKTRRIKVHPYRKSTKEFSAVYMDQDIEAHKGAIWTMKFSPDGQYLASGGEDGVVRVWRVKEIDWKGNEDFFEEDPSCMYFRADHKFQLKPIYINKEKKKKSRGTGDSLHSSCVIIPPDVFRISEKPVHEFRGHGGDVLDISWSKNKCLLSSSIDKTVRLWQVDRDNCINIFSHNDYVTCVQFNPADEKYFISGSIDGKVRLWDISRCHVVDWVDIKEIVSAACFRPDGKEIVVGSMTGNCRFYGFSDIHLQLEAQISFSGKKKFPCKRITGFQFSPSHPRKLLVTSADSQIIILDRFDVICKYKGLRNAGSQISASFTSDGRHIVSASEDSNVYVWNHINRDVPTTNHVKTSWSSEHFFSSNISVAIPWTECRNHLPVIPEAFASKQEVFRDFIGKHESNIWCKSNLHSLASGGCKPGQRLFSEFLWKGSATWPEEKLPQCSMKSQPTVFKSQYKFINSCDQKMAASPHAWGQVIVTAGLDGRIKLFCNYGLPVQI